MRIDEVGFILVSGIFKLAERLKQINQPAEIKL